MIYLHLQPHQNLPINKRVIIIVLIIITKTVAYSQVSVFGHINKLKCGKYYTYMKVDTFVASKLNDALYFNDSVFCIVKKKGDEYKIKEYYSNGLIGCGVYERQIKKGVWRFYIQNKFILYIEYFNGKPGGYELNNFITKKYIRAIADPPF
jgi:hypothetical protein